MVRRIILAAGAAAALSVFLFGRDAASYVGTSLGWVKSTVKNSVPLEFEIDRARGMVKNLVPDIRNNMHIIAQEEVEVERLGHQIAQTEQTLVNDRGELVRLKTDLAKEQPSYEYGGRNYTIKEVKSDLGNRFERFKTHDATLKSLKDMRAARSRSMEAARQKLEQMLAAKRNLEVEVENLEARLKMVAVAQTTSDYQFDDSQLGRAKELIADLRTRLTVAERVAHADIKLQDEIPLAEPTSDNLVDQVNSYLDGKSPASLADKAEAKAADPAKPSAEEKLAAKPKTDT